jgi:hypothetical protein
MRAPGKMLELSHGLGGFLAADDPGGCGSGSIGVSAATAPEADVPGENAALPGSCHSPSQPIGTDAA